MYALASTAFLIIKRLSMSVNFIFAPYLIIKALKKIKEVMKNLVNDSYSRISIWILKIVVLQEVMVMVALSWYVVLISYGYFYGQDYTFKIISDIFFCLKFFLVLTNDTCLVLQGWEWSLMYLMASF